MPISLIVSAAPAPRPGSNPPRTVSAGQLHTDLQITTVELGSAAARHGAAGIGIGLAVGGDALLGRRQRQAVVD